LAAEPRTKELETDERRRMGGEEYAAVSVLWVVGKDH
jgi:hypothetical protein